MENEELITVIVPVYNTAKFLRKCLHSIIQQTYQNLEILIVDDGSTDESISICEEIKRNDNRVSIIRQMNCGVSAARNCAIAAAKGEWLVFVDSDDYIDSDMVEKLYCAVRRYQADYAVCGYACVSENQKLIRKYVAEKEQVVSKVKALEMHYLDEYTVNFVTVWGKIMRHKIWKTLRFEEGMFYEDLEIMPLLLWECNKIVVLDYIGYNYVQRKGSIMHDKKIKEKCYKDAISIFLRHDKFYSEHDLYAVKEANIQLLLDKIITSDIHGAIPIDQVDYSRKVYKENYQIMNKKGMPLIQKIKYWIYKTLGAKGYRLLSMAKR